MNIIYTSDLHSRKEWYHWLLNHARNYDLICLSGDLLDMFSPVNMLEQLYALYRWCQEMEKTGVPVALCSGNHDFAEKIIELGDVSHARPSLFKDDKFVKIFTGGGSYMTRLPGVVCADQYNHIFKDQLLISSCTYSYDQARIESGTLKLLSDAYVLREKLQVPWIILHHEPPQEAGISMVKHQIDCGSMRFGEWVRSFQPDITLSGHLHEAPFINGSCIEKIGKSYCFNCGHDSSSSIPSYVELKLDRRNLDYSWWFKGKVMERKALKINHF